MIHYEWYDRIIVRVTIIVSVSVTVAVTATVAVKGKQKARV